MQERKVVLARHDFAASRHHMSERQISPGCHLLCLQHSLALVIALGQARLAFKRTGAMPENGDLGSLRRYDGRVSCPHGMWVRDS